MVLGKVIRAVQLKPGDMFETLITKAAGICRSRTKGATHGVPVELWYPDRREVLKMLDPCVRVLLVEPLQRVDIIH